MPKELVSKIYSEVQSFTLDRPFILVVTSDDNVEFVKFAS